MHLKRTMCLIQRPLLKNYNLFFEEIFMTDQLHEFKSRLLLNESFFSKEVRHYEFICNASTCHWNVSAACFVIEKWLFLSPTRSDSRKKWFNAAYVTAKNDPKWRRRKLEKSEYTLRVCRPKCFLDRLGFRYENGKKLTTFLRGSKILFSFVQKKRLNLFHVRITSVKKERRK